jgi:signal transduction histidine kinase
VRFRWGIVVFLMAALTPSGSTSAEPFPRSVLVFDQSEPNAPWGLEFRAAVRAGLSSGSPAPVAVYSEILDLGRFNSPRYVELLRAHFREKYRDRPIGVIIAHGSTALEILLPLRADLWPGVPIVFGVVDEATAARLTLPPDVTGTTFRLTLRNAVTAARALVPDLKRIALVGDAFERQPFRRHFAQELPQFTAELEFIDLSGLPMAELRKRVAALPQDAAIYYTAIYVDSEGGTYIARDALPMIAETANRPIVSDVVTHIGYGSTGGIVVLPEPIARETARLALRVLDGESASQIPVTLGDFSRPVFDWRQLQRWNVSESRLPPGSELRFRESSKWAQHRWQVMSTLAVVLTQAALITWLLFERRYRHLAELESRRRFLEVVHLNRTATAGALSASVAHELNQPLGAILSNAEAAEVLLTADPPDLNLLKEILADIRRDDQRAGEIIRHLRGLLKKSDVELEEFDLNDAIHDALHVLEPEAMKRGVVLDAEHARGVFRVRADQVHLQQVVINLAANGMDAMNDCAPGKRRLAFQSALNGRSVVEVSISDSGTGIPNDKLREIFETFYTTKQQGTGLGLSIARTIVETYGGRIWAENKIGGGAVFRFTLPLVQAHPP